MRRVIRLIAMTVLALGAASTSPWAATYTVDSTVDAVDDAPGDGVCSAAGSCTLRAAVQEANAHAGADTIVVPAGTYVLTRPGGPEDFAATGDLDLRETVTITGAGASATIVDGGGVGRVFDARASQTVTIADLTIRNGDATLEGETYGANPSCIGGGGGVCAVGTLALTRVIVRDNVARFGGGLAGLGTMGVTDAVVRDNRAVGGGDLAIAAGGGIASLGGTTVAGSTITGNTVDGPTALLQAGGGIVSLDNHPVTISRSTIGGNAAPAGLAVFSRTVTICPPAFGCVTLTGGSVSIASTTIVENGAAAAIDSDRTTAGSTIVAGTAPGCAGTLTANAYDLIQTPGPACTVGGDTTGNLAGVDPLLTPLGDHTGPTPTYALGAGSPALDAARPTTGPFACQGTDQRGITRPDGDRCDIGAVEGLCGNGVIDALESCEDGNQTAGDGCTRCRLEMAHTWVVDSTTDAVDALPGDGVCATAANECTLRAAIEESNTLPGPDTIVVPPGTYLLTRPPIFEYGAAAPERNGDLDVRDALVVAGAGSDATIVDGGGIARIFDVQGPLPFTIRDVTLQHGAAHAESAAGTPAVAFGAFGGGAVNRMEAGAVTLERVVVRENVAEVGAGVYAVGPLTVVDSEIADNEARGPSGDASFGAGVYVGPGSIVVTGSTFARNRLFEAVFVEGAGALLVFGSGTATIRNSTFSGNDQTLQASVPTLLESVTIVQENPENVNWPTIIGASSVSVRNTVVAGNALACSGSMTSLGHNLLETAHDRFGNGCTLAGGAPGDQTEVDPQLGPLGFHGGATETHAPLAGSPLVDAGDPAAPGSGGNACPATDQRGLTRPDGARCDVGAVEGLCGNGVVDPGEVCDDSNLTSGDGCDANCTIFCGNGVLDPGEACDDGNETAGDCCSPSCAFEPATTVCRPATGDCDVAETCDGAGTCPADALVADGTPCDDGSACTAGDACATGACVPGDPVVCAACEQCDAVAGCVGTPATGCLTTVAPRGSSLVLRDRAVDTGDRITWKWRGQATTEADLGDPTTTDGYTLCLFDESGPTPALVFRATARPGETCGGAACWRRIESGGALKRFKYADRDRTPDGVATMSVAPGPAGRAKLVVGGRGVLLGGRPFGLPSPPLGLPLRMQLLRSGGTCWDATYSSPNVRRNQPGLTSARSD